MTAHNTGAVKTTGGHATVPNGASSVRMVVNPAHELFQLHVRYAHIHPVRLRELLVAHEPATWLRVGKTFDSWASTLNCVVCGLFDQSRRNRVQRPMPRPDGPGMHYSMDMSVGHRKSAVDGYAYFVIIVDLFSRYLWTIPLKRKMVPDFVSAFPTWLRTRRRQHGSGIQQPTMRRGSYLPRTHVTSDRDTVFMSKDVMSLFTAEGVVHDTSVSNQQYGNTVERHVRELNKVRAVITYERCNAKRHWHDVLVAAVQCVNLRPSRALRSSGRQLSPYEMEHGRAPDMSYHLHPMSPGLALIVAHKRRRPSSLEPQRTPVMVCHLATDMHGVPSAKKGWRVYDPASRDYSVAGEVRVHECFTPDTYNIQTLELLKGKSPLPPRFLRVASTPTQADYNAACERVRERSHHGTITNAEAGHLQADLSYITRASAGTLDGAPRCPPCEEVSERTPVSQRTRSSRRRAAQSPPPATDTDPDTSSDQRRVRFADQAASVPNGSDTDSDARRAGVDIADRPAETADRPVTRGNARRTSERQMSKAAKAKVLEYNAAVLTPSDPADTTAGKVVDATLETNDSGEQEWRLTIHWDNNPGSATMSWESDIRKALNGQHDTRDDNMSYTVRPHKLSVRMLATLWKLPCWIVVEWLHKFREPMFAKAQLPRRGHVPMYFAAGTEIPRPTDAAELKELWERYDAFKRCDTTTKRLHHAFMRAGARRPNSVTLNKARCIARDSWQRMKQLIQRMGLDGGDERFAVYVERHKPNAKLAPGEQGWQSVNPSEVDVGNCMFTYNQLCKIASKHQIHTPQTVKEALEGPDKTQWLEAIAKEVNSFKRFGTYTIVKREEIPNGALIMGLKEILKVKFDTDGNLDKYKFRITVQGYTQEEGDYKQKFSPAVAYSTIKTLVAVAAVEHLNLSTMDYSCAFLQADEIDVPNQLYVRLEGSTLEERDPETNEPLFGRIEGSWYGLAQAPAIFARKLMKYITTEAKSRWKQAATDQCLYLHTWRRVCAKDNLCYNCNCRKQKRDMRTAHVINGGECLRGSLGIIRMIVFVDDSMFAWHECDRQKFMQAKTELLEQFLGTFQENAPGIVGMRITRNDNGSITLDQEAYVEMMLTRFGRETGTRRMMPIRSAGINEYSDNPQDENTMSPVNPKDYLSIVSSLAYAQHTHPEIVYTVNRLQRFAHEPKAHHMAAAYHAVDYLRGVKSKGITYGNPGYIASAKEQVHSHDLVCFVDADLPDIVERHQTLKEAIIHEYTRPTTGIVVMFAGAALHSSSHKQPTVVASTAEAEATALHQGAKYLQIYKNLLHEMMVTQPDTLTIVGHKDLQHCDIPPVPRALLLGDNKASLLEVGNVGRGSRLKHMRLKLGRNQQDVENKVYIPYHVGTKQQLADGNTKGSVTGGVPQFIQLRDSLRGDRQWKLDLEVICPLLSPDPKRDSAE